MIDLSGQIAKAARQHAHLTDTKLPKAVLASHAKALETQLSGFFARTTPVLVGALAKRVAKKPRAKA